MYMKYTFRIALQPFTDVVSIDAVPIASDQLQYAQLYFVYQQGNIVDVIYDIKHFERNVQSDKFECNTIYACFGQNVVHKDVSNVLSKKVPRQMLCTLDRCEKMLNDMDKYIDNIKDIFIWDEYNLEKSKILFLGWDGIYFTDTLFKLPCMSAADLIVFGNRKNPLTHVLFKNKKFNEIDKIVLNISTYIEKHYFVEKSIQCNWLAVWISKVYDNLLEKFPRHREYILEIKTSMVMECLTK